jgi:hypothetical protein
MNPAIAAAGKRAGGASLFGARRRVALTIGLAAAAMPIRLTAGFPVVNSISLLDVVLLLAGLTLFLDLEAKPLDVGPRGLLWLVCSPLLLSIASIAWSQDVNASIRVSIIYAEGVVAYLFVIRELSGLTARRVMIHIERFTYLLIIPGILLLLHVPGFAPELTGVKHSSGDYLSYYTRLSHPVLGRSNNLATVLAFFAPLLVYWAYTTRQRRFTVVSWVACLAILMTLSRGVLLAFLIGGLLCAPLVQRSRESRRLDILAKIAALGALVAITVAVLYSVDATTRATLAGRFNLVNVHTRAAVMKLGLSKVGERPLIGFGAGTFPDRAPLLVTEGSVHNTYLQQIVYYGIPLGIGLCLALCGLARFFVIRGRFTSVSKVVAYTLAVQLIIFLWESSFEGTVLKVIFFMSIGLAVGLVRAAEVERGWIPEPRPSSRGHAACHDV